MRSPQQGGGNGCDCPRLHLRFRRISWSPPCRIPPRCPIRRVGVRARVDKHAVHPPHRNTLNCRARRGQIGAPARARLAPGAAAARSKLRRSALHPCLKTGQAAPAPVGASCLLRAQSLCGHQQAGSPSGYVCAGHRPRTCAPVRGLVSSEAEDHQQFSLQSAMKLKTLADRGSISTWNSLGIGTSLRVQARRGSDTVHRSECAKTLGSIWTTPL